MLGNATYLRAYEFSKNSKGQFITDLMSADGNKDINLKKNCA